MPGLSKEFIRIFLPALQKLVGLVFSIYSMFLSSSVFLQSEGRSYFYRQIFDKRTHQFSRIYISKKDVGLAGALAKKGYFLKIKPIIEKQLIALKRFSEDRLRYETDNGELVRSSMKTLLQVLINKYAGGYG